MSKIRGCVCCLHNFFRGTCLVMYYFWSIFNFLLGEGLMIRVWVRVRFRVRGSVVL